MEIDFIWCTITSEWALKKKLWPILWFVWCPGWKSKSAVVADRPKIFFLPNLCPLIVSSAQKRNWQNIASFQSCGQFSKNFQNWKVKKRTWAGALIRTCLGAFLQHFWPFLIWHWKLFGYTTRSGVGCYTAMVERLKISGSPLVANFVEQKRSNIKKEGV